MEQPKGFPLSDETILERSEIWSTFMQNIVESKNDAEDFDFHDIESVSPTGADEISDDDAAASDMRNNNENESQCKALVKMENFEGMTSSDDFDDYANKTMALMKEAKQKWTQCGMVNVLETFDLDEIKKKVVPWIEKNKLYNFYQGNNSTSVDEHIVHIEEHHQRQVHVASDDDSLHSIDTANYIRSSRKKKTSTCTTTTIKKFSYVKGSRKQLEEKYGLRFPYSQAREIVPNERRKSTSLTPVVLRALPFEPTSAPVQRQKTRRMKRRSDITKRSLSSSSSSSSGSPPRYFTPKFRRRSLKRNSIFDDLPKMPVSREKELPELPKPRPQTQRADGGLKHISTTENSKKETELHKHRMKPVSREKHGPELLKMKAKVHAADIANNSSTTDTEMELDTRARKPVPRENRGRELPKMKAKTNAADIPKHFSTTKTSETEKELEKRPKQKVSRKKRALELPETKAKAPAAAVVVKHVCTTETSETEKEVDKGSKKKASRQKYELELPKTKAKTYAADIPKNLSTTDSEMELDTRARKPVPRENRGLESPKMKAKTKNLTTTETSETEKELDKRPKQKVSKEKRAHELPETKAKAPAAAVVVKHVCTTETSETEKELEKRPKQKVSRKKRALELPETKAKAPAAAVVVKHVCTTETSETEKEVDKGSKKKASRQKYELELPKTKAKTYAADIPKNLSTTDSEMELDTRARKPVPRENRGLESPKMKAKTKNLTTTETSETEKELDKRPKQKVSKEKRAHELPKSKAKVPTVNLISDSETSETELPSLGAIPDIEAISSNETGFAGTSLINSTALPNFHQSSMPNPTKKCLLTPIRSKPIPQYRNKAHKARNKSPPPKTQNINPPSNRPSTQPSKPHKDHVTKKLELKNVERPLDDTIKAAEEACKTLVPEDKSKILLYCPTNIESHREHLNGNRFHLTREYFFEKVGKKNSRRFIRLHSKKFPYEYDRESTVYFKIPEESEESASSDEDVLYMFGREGKLIVEPAANKK